MKAILLILLFSISQWAIAETIEQQSLQLCEKIKSCAAAEIEGEDMTAEMKAMIMSSMDGMCMAMASEFNNDRIKDYAELRKQATACMTSLLTLSCSQLMNGETNTPACIALEKSAAQDK
ncbi:MAG: hypothetical protein Q9N32_00330 [Gammaproteobacteria bacterium]|nr:hypothetical protein [Gammaproteobacteria bacterium]